METIEVQIAKGIDLDRLCRVTKTTVESNTPYKIHAMIKSRKDFTIMLQSENVEAFYYAGVAAAACIQGYMDSHPAR